MVVKEIIVKSAVNNVAGWLPYDWDLNIYRGCLHQCEYCFAMYSHRYLDNSNFFGDIYVKTNIAEVLDQTLTSRKLKKKIINVGGVCDSYQPLERKYELMKGVLKVFIKHRHPMMISTKSDLILRDFNLIKKLSEIAPVNVAVTIITLEDEIRKKIEPNTSSPLERLNILKQFKNTNVNIGLHLMPIIPMLTDNQKNLENIFSKAKDIGVDYIITGILNLKGPTKTNFLKFIKNQFPDFIIQYLKLYPKSSLAKSYASKIHQKIDFLEEKYQLTSSFFESLEEKKKNLRVTKDSIDFFLKK